MSSCICGCGLPAVRQFAHGHNRRAPAERFWDFVDKSTPSGCWLWTGALDRSGYGRFKRRPRTFGAHRYAYELTQGAIPEGLQLDHLCGVPRCVNPDHLEPVTRAENMRRQAQRRATCRAGLHDFTDPAVVGTETKRHRDGSTRISRFCRPCRAARRAVA